MTIDERADQARRALDAIESTLSTLTKMARDIEPSYCTDGDLATLTIVGDLLNEAEDKMADLCAENVERAGDAPAPVSYVEMGTGAIVQVVRWDWNTAHLADGTTANRNNLYRPKWLVDAERQEADAQDQAETQSDALGVGAQ